MAVNLTFIKDDRVIQIDNPQVSASVQDLVNQIRNFEDNSFSMDLEQIVIATGKDSLGGGLSTGITMNLINDWRIQFEERSGPSTEFCLIEGGNTIALNSFDNRPIKPSAFTSVTIAQAVSVVSVAAEPTITAGDVWMHPTGSKVGKDTGLIPAIV